MKHRAPGGIQVKQSVAPTINPTIPASELYRTEEWRCDLPKRFPFLLLVLNLLCRASKVLPFICSLENRIYRQQVAGILLGKFQDDRVSSTISFLGGSIKLTCASRRLPQRIGPGLSFSQGTLYCFKSEQRTSFEFS